MDLRREATKSPETTTGPGHPRLLNSPSRRSLDLPRRPKYGEGTVCPLGASARQIRELKIKSLKEEAGFSIARLTRLWASPSG